MFQGSVVRAISVQHVGKDLNLIKCSFTWTVVYSIPMQVQWYISRDIRYWILSGCWNTPKMLNYIRSLASFISGLQLIQVQNNIWINVRLGWPTRERKGFLTKLHFVSKSASALYHQSFWLWGKAKHDRVETIAPISCMRGMRIDGLTLFRGRPSRL